MIRGITKNYRGRFALGRRRSRGRSRRHRTARTERRRQDDAAAHHRHRAPRRRRRRCASSVATRTRRRPPAHPIPARLPATGARVLHRLHGHRLPRLRRHPQGDHRSHRAAPARCVGSSTSSASTDVADRKIRKLSGGMRRRVAIAQAMLGRPQLLIFDEPTAGLDPEQRLRFREVVSHVAAERTVLLSTHQTDDVAAALRPRGRPPRRARCGSPARPTSSPTACAGPCVARRPARASDPIVVAHRHRRAPGDRPAPPGRPARRANDRGRLPDARRHPAAAPQGVGMTTLAIPTAAAPPSLGGRCCSSPPSRPGVLSAIPAFVLGIVATVLYHGGVGRRGAVDRSALLQRDDLVGMALGREPRRSSCGRRP